MRDGNIQISISQPGQTRHVWIFNGGGEVFVIGKGVAWIWKQSSLAEL